MLRCFTRLAALAVCCLPLALAVLCLLAAAPPAKTFPTADEPAPTVSLILSKVSAQRYKSETVFSCEVILDNATGGELRVLTRFASVFDGLELVVTSKQGKTLVRQPYIYHQAPFAPPARAFTLKRGITTGKVIFPISAIPGDPKGVKVRLVGTLPGSAFRSILSTETFEVTLQE